MQLAHPLLLWFDSENEGKRENRVRPATPSGAEEERLFCALCRAPITHRSEAIEIAGAHRHTCTNPHGFVFRIGCFRQAQGCRTESVATLEHSWFAGYAWSIADCARCERHLGWLFSGSSDRFFGLIGDRLSAR